jgi:hypothetical protein
MRSDVHSGGFARNNFFLDLNGEIIIDVLAHSLACFFSRPITCVYPLSPPYSADSGCEDRYR